MSILTFLHNDFGECIDYFSHEVIIWYNVLLAEKFKNIVTLQPTLSLA